MKLKHFDSVTSAVSYAVEELASSLREDLDRMKGEERRFYETADRREMRNRIADMDTIAPLLLASPDLLEALRRVGKQLAELQKDISEAVTKAEHRR